MIKRNLSLILARFSMVVCFVVLFYSCDKSVPDDGVNVAPYYNLDVTFLPVDSKTFQSGEGAGFLKFRQDPDTARIITLDISVFNLEPNHSYQLQRAVDPITATTCESTTWLTLGEGLVPQTINTDAKGNGEADLFRDVTSIARGSQFRIHFQIVDAVTGATVLTSDCFQYTVR
jgi:hypothetical protein